jgi:hypothetical protein
VTASHASTDGDDLAVRLARWADGLGCVEWGVRWLIATGWTDDPEFVAACVVETECRGELVACVDWHSVRAHAQRVTAPVERALAIGLAYDLATEPWRLADLPSTGGSAAVDRS